MSRDQVFLRHILDAILKIESYAPMVHAQVLSLMGNVPNAGSYLKSPNSLFHYIRMIFLCHQ